MSELAKCRCGAAADAPEADRGDYYRIECLGECDFYVSAPTIEGVVSVWNSLMRPRPVAEWEWRSGTYAQYLSCEHVDLGYVMWKRGCVPPWVAYCVVTNEESGPMMLEDARAWLEERVKAAGFEVREESSRA